MELDTLMQKPMWKSKYIRLGSPWEKKSYKGTNTADVAVIKTVVLARDQTNGPVVRVQKHTQVHVDICYIVKVVSQITASKINFWCHREKYI